MCVYIYILCICVCVCVYECVYTVDREILVVKTFIK